MNTHQVTIENVHLVGEVLKTGELGRILREGSVVFVPTICGWRGAICIVAGQADVTACCD